jgi:hypothetical protein
VHGLQERAKLKDLDNAKDCAKNHTWVPYLSFHTIVYNLHRNVIHARSASQVERSENPVSLFYWKTLPNKFKDWMISSRTGCREHLPLRHGSQRGCGRTLVNQLAASLFVLIIATLQCIAHSRYPCVELEGEQIIALSQHVDSL